MKPLPYRLHHINTPTHPPFDGVYGWPTIVRELIVNVVQNEKELIYWFCQEGPFFQFCFASENFKKIEEALERRMQEMKMTRKLGTAPDDGATTATAFAGPRWVAPDKNGEVEFVTERSHHILRLVHSTCELYAHSLRQDPATTQWKLEPNSDSQQNPLGNLFESVLHLVSNISQAEFDVHIGHATAYMPLKIVKSLRCHL